MQRTARALIDETGLHPEVRAWIKGRIIVTSGSPRRLLPQGEAARASWNIQFSGDLPATRREIDDALYGFGMRLVPQSTDIEIRPNREELILQYVNNITDALRKTSVQPKQQKVQWHVRTIVTSSGSAKSSSIDGTLHAQLTTATWKHSDSKDMNISC